MSPSRYSKQPKIASSFVLTPTYQNTLLFSQRLRQTHRIQTSAMIKLGTNPNQATI